MDVTPFIQLTLNSRYISRWIFSGLAIYIPVLNFLSLGYLSKTSRLVIVGGLGLPIWDGRRDIWLEGVKVIFIFVLYEAIPLFLFSSGFFLTTLSPITAFFGKIIMKLSYAGILLFSFPLPFAFATFAERADFRHALEYERIIQAIREVLLPYLVGYLATLLALYICKLLLGIPYLVGFVISSVVTYYVFLVATYYFTELYKKTSLFSEGLLRDREGVA
jgi:hypothetical protein